jgi:hypothetical protein
MNDVLMSLIPVGVHTGHDEEDEYRCPHCGWEAVILAYDAIGADLGNVFCNGCNAEVAA